MKAFVLALLIFIMARAAWSDEYIICNALGQCNGRIDGQVGQYFITPLGSQYSKSGNRNFESHTNPLGNNYGRLNGHPFQEFSDGLGNYYGRIGNRNYQCHYNQTLNSLYCR